MHGTALLIRYPDSEFINEVREGGMELGVSRISDSTFGDVVRMGGISNVADGTAVAVGRPF